MQPSKRVVAGRITGVYGIRGWVRVKSYTDPAANLVSYQPWWIRVGDRWEMLGIDQSRPEGKGIIAHITGIDDRDQARRYCQQDLFVDADQFPDPGPGEYYWHQLEGMRVVTRRGDRTVDLGRVGHLMSTGANDVLVVKGDGGSVDRRERLVPFVDQYVLQVKPETGEIEVDWDPEF